MFIPDRDRIKTMLAFFEHRRSPPVLNQIRPGMGASCSAVRRLEERCEELGIKMTDLRRILLHGLLEAGPQTVDFHRELTREGYKFPLRIDPCLTLLRFQLTGALWRSDQHGFIERCASLASS
jgi:hypothetical protein